MYFKSYLLLGSILFAQTIATDVWVDSVSGSDTASGTQAAPLQTIAKALDLITTTDAYKGQSSVVHLVSANYTVGAPVSYLYISSNGLNLTITSTVRSTLITPGGFYGVYVGGNGTVTFDNISIYPTGGISASRVLYVWQSTVTLNNCYFAGFEVQMGPALYFDGGEASVTINKCLFEDITPGIQASAVVYISGITNTTWNAVIRDTTIKRVNNTKYALYLWNTNVTITNSVIEDNENEKLIYCGNSDIESSNTKINTTANPILECYYCVVHTNTPYGIAASGCSIFYTPTTTGSGSSTASATTSSSTTSSAMKLYSWIAFLAVVLVVI